MADRFCTIVPDPMSMFIYVSTGRPLSSHSGTLHIKNEVLWRLSVVDSCKLSPESRISSQQGLLMRLNVVSPGFMWPHRASRSPRSPPMVPLESRGCAML